MDQEFFAEKEVEPVELDVSEDAVVDTSTAFAPDALQMPIPANDPSAFEKRRLRLKQQFLAAINMTDETITNDKRNEVFNFFGYSTIERPPDAKDDSIPKKYTSEKKNSVVSTKTPKAKAKQTVSRSMCYALLYIVLSMQLTHSIHSSARILAIWTTTASSINMSLPKYCMILM